MLILKDVNPKSKVTKSGVKLGFKTNSSTKTELKLKLRLHFGFNPKLI